jgi:hypothetical protein
MREKAALRRIDKKITRQIAEAGGFCARALYNRGARNEVRQRCQRRLWSIPRTALSGLRLWNSPQGIRWSADRRHHASQRGQQEPQERLFIAVLEEACKGLQEH